MYVCTHFGIESCRNVQFESFFSLFTIYMLCIHKKTEHSSWYHAKIVWVVCTHIYICTTGQCPPLSVSRAARAKLQRLERENHQLEKTVATLRHAQAKAEELEKANKKLHGGAHDSRREIIKLKGVGIGWLRIGYA